MAKQKIEAETQGKHYKVDVRRIRPLQRAGGNPRTDYGDLDGLAADIEQNGVIVHLRGFRVSDDPNYDWEIVAGHRRLAACMKLVEKGLTVVVPIDSIGDTRKVTDEQILKEHLTTNSGKEFNPVEMAETLKRLSALGYSTKDLADNFVKKSQRYVQNMLNLAAAPKRIRDLVSSKTISYTLVLEILKNSADFNAACDEIEKVLGSAKSAPKKEGGSENSSSGKITKSAYNAATNKVDSVKELSFALKNQGDKGTDKPEMLKFLKRLLNNELTRADIEKELFTI